MQTQNELLKIQKLIMHRQKRLEAYFLQFCLDLANRHFKHLKLNSNCWVTSLLSIYLRKTGISLCYPSCLGQDFNGVQVYNLQWL